MEIIKLNLVPGSVSPVVHASQYDKNRTFRAMLYDGSESYVLSTEIISVRVRKPDGHFATAAVPVTSGNNYVDVTLIQQMCAVQGKCICELNIINGSKDIGTLNFILDVERDPIAGALESKSEITGLNAVIDSRVDEDISTIANTNTSSKTATKISPELKEYPSDGYLNVDYGYFVSNNDYTIYTYTFTEDTNFTLEKTSGNGLVGVILYNQELETLPISSSASEPYFLKGARNDKTGDQALPIGDDYWTCQAGQMVAIFAQDKSKPTTDFSMGYSLTETKMDESLLVNDNQIKQTLSSIKKPKLLYQGSDQGHVYIYLPTKVGYVKYNFRHFVGAGSHVDTWIIHPCYSVSDDLTERFAITTSGEWECAIKIDGAPDFIGGGEHGSEVNTIIKFFIDGYDVDITKYRKYTDFDEFRVVEVSNLYDPSDEVTIVADHLKEYIFTKDGITLNQQIIWKGSYTMDASYMAMFPVAKSSVDNLVVNDKAEVIDLTQGSFTSNATKSMCYGDDLLCDFSILTWDISAQNKTGCGKFYVTDNSGHDYYKHYFYCLESGTVQNGDLWKTVTKWNIQVGN